jgi:hypothetical protein
MPCLPARAAVAALIAAAAGALGGCHRFDPKHPIVGTPLIQLDAQQPGYYVWFNDGTWQMRMVAGNAGHRFQGSLAVVRGHVAVLQVMRPELRDRIAVVGESVQFDVEGVPGELDGFATRLSGAGCARFDLYLDGRPVEHHHVHLGPRAQIAQRLPFERCP